MNSIDEKALREKFSVGIKAYMNIFNNPPSIPCISCKRLCCERDVKIVADVIVDNFDFDEEILNKKYT